MSLKDASFQVHNFVQNIFPCKYFVNMETNCLQPHPLYNNIYHRMIRYWILFGSGVGLPITLLYLIWLFSHQNSDQFVLQLLVYTIGFLSLLIVHYCNYVMVTLSEEREYLINQANLTYQCEELSTTSMKLGKYTVKELFIYVFSITFLIFVVGIYSLPFIISFDPIQLILGDSYFVKVFCSLAYGTGSALLLWYFLSFMLLYIGALEMAEIFSRKLTFNKPELVLKESVISLKFHKCYKRYLISRLLFDLGKISVADFVAILICVGVLLISITTTGSIKMWGRLQLLIYVVQPACSIMGITHALVVTQLAGKPYVNGVKFQKFWKKYVTKKVDRKILRATRYFGLDVGPYGVCTPKLGLAFCSDVFENTADFLLIL